jgi:membrane-associated phospholipid phosphatase
MPLMVLLGLGVRDGETGIDGFFQRASGGPLHSLLFFTDPRTVSAVMLGSIGVAVVRRLWALLPLIVLAPYLGVWVSQVLKPLFGRMKGDALAYPSGHTTLMVVALGMLVLAVGARRWALAAVGVFAALGILGQATAYHYFTDSVGSLLLGTSLVCLAAVVLRRVRRLRPFIFR